MKLSILMKLEQVANVISKANFLETVFQFCRNNYLLRKLDCQIFKETTVEHIP